MPGPGRYLYGDEETKEIEDVLRTGHLSRYGSEEDPDFNGKVIKLEENFSRITGSRYSLAVNSGTNALICGLIALGIGEGDEVLVSGYTFIASISAVFTAGADPVLVDIDKSLTMDPDDILRKITKKTKAVMTVHMTGNPCKMERILKIAKDNNLAVIEDSCQALGGKYKDRYLGTLGSIGAFSLNIHKVINTGDGGMLVTDDRELYEKSFAYHDQGHSPLRADVEIGRRKMIGVNMRMNELTGAYALGQLGKLEIILNMLRTKKQLFKTAIQDSLIGEYEFREINDKGECATILTVIFGNKKTAEKAAELLGSKTLEKSGWHVYNNMENVLELSEEKGITVNKKHCLKNADDLLGRSVNLSIGVLDPGIGTDFGISIKSSEDEIAEKAENFVKAVQPVL